MKCNHRTLGLAAVLSLAAIGTAYAQSPAQPQQYGCMQGGGPGMGMMGGEGMDCPCQGKMMGGHGKGHGFNHGSGRMGNM